MRLTTILLCVQILDNKTMGEPVAGRGMASERVEPSANLSSEHQVHPNMGPPPGLGPPFGSRLEHQQWIGPESGVQQPPVFIPMTQVPSGYSDPLPGANYGYGPSYVQYDNQQEAGRLNPVAAEFTPSSDRVAHNYKNECDSCTIRNSRDQQILSAFQMMAEQWEEANNMNHKLIEAAKAQKKADEETSKQEQEARSRKRQFNNYKRQKYRARKRELRDEAMRNGVEQEEHRNKPRSFECYKKRYHEYSKRLEKKNKAPRRELVQEVEAQSPRATTSAGSEVNTGTRVKLSDQELRSIFRMKKERPVSTPVQSCAPEMNQSVPVSNERDDDSSVRVAEENLEAKKNEQVNETREQISESQLRNDTTTSNPTPSRDTERDKSEIECPSPSESIGESLSQSQVDELLAEENEGEDQPGTSFSEQLNPESEIRPSYAQVTELGSQITSQARTSKPTFTSLGTVTCEKTKKSRTRVAEGIKTQVSSTTNKSSGLVMNLEQVKDTWKLDGKKGTRVRYSSQELPYYPTKEVKPTEIKTIVKGLKRAEKVKINNVTREKLEWTTASGTKRKPFSYNQHTSIPAGWNELSEQAKNSTTTRYTSVGDQQPKECDFFPVYPNDQQPPVSNDQPKVKPVILKNHTFSSESAEPTNKKAKNHSAQYATQWKISKHEAPDGIGHGMSSQESSPDEDSSIEWDDGYEFQNKNFGKKPYQAQDRDSPSEGTHIPVPPLAGKRDLTWSKIREKLGRVKTVAAKFLHNQAATYLKEQLNGYNKTGIRPPIFNSYHLIKKMTASSYRTTGRDRMKLGEFLSEIKDVVVTPTNNESDQSLNVVEMEDEDYSNYLLEAREQIHLVQREGQCKATIRYLKQQKILFCDTEYYHCRDGEECGFEELHQQTPGKHLAHLTTVQIGTRHRAYIFDLFPRRNLNLMMKWGLRDILENVDSPPKWFFDSRNDAEALKRDANVDLRNYSDLQSLWSNIFCSIIGLDCGNGMQTRPGLNTLLKILECPVHFLKDAIDWTNHKVRLYWFRNNNYDTRNARGRLKMKYCGLDVLVLGNMYDALIELSDNVPKVHKQNEEDRK
jgi:hypothetical protein